MPPKDNRAPDAQGYGQGYAYFGMALNFTIAILLFGALGWLIDGWLHTRPLVAIAELTRMLPDDTYLTQLQLLQRKVTISGRSASASRLIGSLAAGDQLRNPAFAAPVTRIGTSEAFTISVEIGP